MKVHSLAFEHLVDYLVAGPLGGGTEVLAEFAEVWEERFGNRVRIKEEGPGFGHFISEHEDIRLRGMDQLHCWVFCGDPAKVQQTIKDRWRDIAVPGRISLALVSSESAGAAGIALANLRYVVLDDAAVRKTLGHDRPVEQLKRFVRDAIPLRSLIPYSTLHSVQANMFYGRKKELDRLFEEDGVSFAIAGPGRIGKTSLMKEYERQLVRRRDPRMHGRRYVDFYECSNKTAGGIVHFLAMALDGTKRSFEVAPPDLPNFLKRLKNSVGSAPELLLDETDEVCSTQPFQILAQEAKRGVCRVILAGRGKLLEMMLHGGQSEGRLALMRLDPLSDDEARNLLLEPLADLGIVFEDPDASVRQLIRQTGKLPHLIQFYGRKLAETAAERNTRILTEGDVNILKWDFETVQYFTAPLDLPSPRAKLAALTLLLSEDGPWTLIQIQALLMRERMLLSLDETRDLCNELTINNVLAWINGSFQAANAALAYYARETSYLNAALREARNMVFRRAG